MGKVTGISKEFNCNKSGASSIRDKNKTRINIKTNFYLVSILIITTNNNYYYYHYCYYPP